MRGSEGELVGKVASTRDLSNWVMSCLFLVEFHQPKISKVEYLALYPLLKLLLTQDLSNYCRKCSYKSGDVTKAVTPCTDVSHNWTVLHASPCV